MTMLKSQPKEKRITFSEVVLLGQPLYTLIDRKIMGQRKTFCLLWESSAFAQISMAGHLTKSIFLKRDTVCSEFLPDTEFIMVG